MKKVLHTIYVYPYYIDVHVQFSSLGRLGVFLTKLTTFFLKPFTGAYNQGLIEHRLHGK